MAKRSPIPPGRRQYLEMKAQHPDALLLFRMGDFYETFDDDARTMARVLEIALTQRDVGGGEKSPLAGIPHHSLDAYLGRLVKSGLKVAICEQIGDPAAARGVVDRAVVRIVTPGTVLEPGLLDEGLNNYLAALFVDGERAGVAYVDVSTSEFHAGQLSASDAITLISNLEPSEIVMDESGVEATRDISGGWIVRTAGPGSADFRLAADVLKQQFGSATLVPFGLEEDGIETLAAAAVMQFLRDSQMGAVPQITSVTSLGSGVAMLLDGHALRDLEILESASMAGVGPSLLSVLDRTRTSMGKRRLRSWLMQPLLSIDAIKERQASVEWLAADGTRRNALGDALSKIPDLERLTNRVRNFTASPRDLGAIAKGLEQLPVIAELLADAEDRLRLERPAPGSGIEEVIAAIRSHLQEPAPAAAGNGDTIMPGIDADLDEARSLSGNARGRIAAMEAEFRDSTGVGSLKVGYNRVFGYYVEVSRPNLASIPADFERRQTLVNAERFITPELKSLESRIVSAHETISGLERSVFHRLTNDVGARSAQIMEVAAIVSHLDACYSLAECAARNGWTRPEMNEGDEFIVKEGRHPIVESALGPGRFVPNDISLSARERQLAIVTGPNMAGKSTYIRQVGIIAVMSQIGSFVPARSAQLGVVDRVFTRCNLTDEITAGKSTFLLEMEETATILHQATRHSLVILDEIGRGTSTYDGLAIARAVAEHIHSAPGLGCKTLFATHYHEMTALTKTLPRAFNLQVAVAEEADQVIFLHKILEGGADRSYGVHVGRLAGLPPPVITRAWELLDQLESGDRNRTANGRMAAARQLTLVDPEESLRSDVAELDLDALTPLEALNRLYALREKARGKTKSGK